MFDKSCNPRRIPLLDPWLTERVTYVEVDGQPVADVRWCFAAIVSADWRTGDGWAVAAADSASSGSGR